MQMSLKILISKQISMTKIQNAKPLFAAVGVKNN